MRAYNHTLAAAMLAGTLLLAGCGADSTPVGIGAPTATLGAPTPAVAETGEDNTKLDDAALKKSIQAAGRGVSTVRAIGDVRSSDGRRRIGYDLRFDQSRKSYIGSMTVDGRTIELRRIGADLYLRAGADYWTAAGKLADPSDAGRVHEKYVRIEADNARFEDVTEIADYGSVATAVMDWGSTPIRRSEEMLDGRRMLVLTFPDPDDGDVRLYVPATGSPVPVRLLAPGPYTVDWSDPGKPVEITAPPAAATVALPPLNRRTRPSAG
ncbi:hypothetical protein ACIBSV_21420 [Embleya sp. NPDC050154]|uniref:hypothetical protein n=1 Tax=Embleya sp. NPDC050154 TaxID=3363988 RepID=UPI00379C0F32